MAQQSNDSQVYLLKKGFIYIYIYINVIYTEFYPVLDALTSTALNHSCRCRTCGGSGLSYCPRCLGTGEYRYIMGFHFMKMDSAHTRDQLNVVESNQKRRTAADLYEE